LVLVGGGSLPRQFVHLVKIRPLFLNLHILFAMHFRVTLLFFEQLFLRVRLPCWKNARKE